MPAGDYVVRRNNADTSVIADAGTPNTLLWDTAVATVGSGITYSSGTFTLAEAGAYLVLCSDCLENTQTTSDERLNWKTYLELEGSELVEGYSTGYISKASGQQSFITFSAAVINAGAADELKIITLRIDDTTASIERPARKAGETSGITILKLDDDASIGRYESSDLFATHADDNSGVYADISTAVAQEHPFSLKASNNVRCYGTNLVLAVYSIKIEDTDIDALSEYQCRLTLDEGAHFIGAMGQTYIRDADNCIWGGFSGMALMEPDGNDDVRLQVLSRENGGLDARATLQLVELPSTAEAIVIAASNSGNANADATDFSWDSSTQYGTAFTYGDGNANCDVKNGGDYLTFGGMWEHSGPGSGGTRTTPSMLFRVGTDDKEWAGHSSYSRGTSNAKHFALGSAALLPGLSANDSVYTRTYQFSDDTTTTTIDSGNMFLVRLDSWLGRGPEPGSLQMMGIGR